MRDTLPNKINKIECGIVNLDSIENQGTHWVCYYKNNDESFYFDSFGLDPPNELVNYIKVPIIMNTFQIQKFNTSICGQLCLHVLKQLIKGKDFKQIVIELL